MWKVFHSKSSGFGAITVLLAMFLTSMTSCGEKPMKKNSESVIEGKVIGKNGIEFNFKRKFLFDCDECRIIQGEAFIKLEIDSHSHVPPMLQPSMELVLIIRTSYVSAGSSKQTENAEAAVVLEENATYITNRKGRDIDAPLVKTYEFIGVDGNVVTILGPLVSDGPYTAERLYDEHLFITYQFKNVSPKHFFDFDRKLLNFLNASKQKN